MQRGQWRSLDEMEKFSPIEIRVKELVDDFFTGRITRAELKGGLSRAKVGLRPKKQRRLPKSRGKTFS
jgi:hypothetical protein